MYCIQQGQGLPWEHAHHHAHAPDFWKNLSLQKSESGELLMVYNEEEQHHEDH
jgi:hypothetical protein